MPFSWRSVGGARPPGARVICRCELLDVGAGNIPLVLLKKRKHS